MNLCFLLLVFVAIFGCSTPQSDLKALAPVEKFPADVFLDSVSKKKALVIVAHDRDLAGMAGTLAKLKTAGWEVNQLCFVSGEAERDSALVRASSLIMDGVDFIHMLPGERRTDLDTIEHPFMPIPKEQLAESFRLPEIASRIRLKVQEFNPSVIFTLDNEIGTFGHPEHILVSLLVVDLYHTDSIRPDRIYQHVYPNSMEEKIIKVRLTKVLDQEGQPNPYMAALDMYESTGMPEPSVEVNIQDQAEAKMNFLRAFNEPERKYISHYMPYFEDFEPDVYFRVFDREFFRVIAQPHASASL